MLAFALRRAVWAVPTLFGVSLVVFLLTTLLPEPTADRNIDPGDVVARVELDEARRARFLDLPRLLNAAPKDVRTYVDECVAHIVMPDADTPYYEARLATLGGAALPHLLPHLDDIPPAERGRVARALAPVARRMGIGEEAELTTPDKAALFWERFWEDHSIDFTNPSVRRSVQRLARRTTSQREEDLYVLDTFALRELVAAMKTTTDPEGIARLTRVASHVTGRDAALVDTGEPARMRAVVSAWQSWWYVHEPDYVALQGGEKVASSVAQTRYAKWMLGAVTGQLGLSRRDGVPVFDKLVARAPVTLGMAFLALLLAGVVAIPLGVVSALRKGTAIDTTTGLVLLLVYSIPTFLIALVLAQVRDVIGAGILLPVVALATVSISLMTQQQRAFMIDALAQDYIRAARAKGARTLRVAVVHALRNALVPTVTLAGVQFPALLGGTFVVEEVFGVRGMGWETLRAIEARDAAWIVAVTLLSAAVTTISLVASDVAYGLLDPRVREAKMRRRG